MRSVSDRSRLFVEKVFGRFEFREAHENGRRKIYFRDYAKSLGPARRFINKSKCGVYFIHERFWDVFSINV